MDKEFDERQAGALDAYKSPHARVLALAAENMKKIDDFPFEQLLALVASAATQAQIGQAVGVPQPAISRWLHALRGERADQLEAALQAAGLECLDKGLAELEAARGGDAATVQLARAFENHWARRAGLYHRRWHDKGELPNAQPEASIAIPSFVINVLPANNAQQGITIEHGDTDLV